MTRDRWTYERMPAEPIRRAVIAWLRRHGVDEERVAVPGFIERQPDLYRLAWKDFARDDAGKPVWDREVDDAVRVVRYVQLEGPPLPWPSEVTAQARGVPRVG
jgi:hypothetical protein